MKDLTAKQQLIWDMQQVRKMTHTEIAAELGISQPVVNKTLSVCRKKMGLTGTASPNFQGPEYRKPEVAAMAIEAAADPMARTFKDAIERANEILEASGIPGKVNEALVKRMRVKYADAVTVTRELRTNEILEMLGKKIDLAAFYLDDKVLAEANARDIMLGLGVMIEKRNLLRGEPTAIISDHERKKLNELLPALIAETQRRHLNVTVEGVVLP